MGKKDPSIKLLQDWNYFHIHNDCTVTAVEQLLNAHNKELQNQAPDVASQRKLIL